MGLVVGAWMNTTVNRGIEVVAGTGVNGNFALNVKILASASHRNVVPHDRSSSLSDAKSIP